MKYIAFLGKNTVSQYIDRIYMVLMKYYGSVMAHSLRGLILLKSSCLSLHIYNKERLCMSPSHVVSAF
jgi:hypothetical protein